MKILIPTDGSELSEHALAGVAAFARAVRAEVTLLTVLDPGAAGDTTSSDHLTVPREYRTGGPAVGAVAPHRSVVEDHGQALTRLRTETEEGLRALAAKYDLGGTVGVMARFGEKPAETIVEVADGYDLIAMGTHGRSGLGQAVLGSVAASVAREAPIPVMIVNDRAGRAARG